MKWIHPFKLKYQLYILFALLLFVLIFVTLLSFTNLWESFYMDTIEQARSSNNQISQNLSTRLDYFVDSTSYLSNDSTLCAYLELQQYDAASSYLAQISRNFRDTNRGKIRDIRLIYEHPENTAEEKQLLQEAFSENTSLRFNNYMFQSTRLNTRNELVFGLIYPIENAGNTAACIYIEIYESEIYTYINKSAFPINIYYQDQMISSTSRDVLYQQPLSPLVSQTDSQNFIYTANNKDFVVETNLSAYDFQHRFYDNYLNVILYIVVAIITTTTFLFIVVRYLEKRFSLLNQKVQLLGDWNFTHSIAIPGNDEFSQLSAIIDQSRQNIWNLLQEVNNTNRLRRHAEIKALRSQIDSHFLFNSLSTIKWLAKTGQLHEIEKSIGYLSTFLHFSLRMEEDTVPLRQEVEQLDAYLNLEKLKFQDEINFHILIDDDILDLPCAKIILQPIVENSTTHARRDDRSCLNITIYGYREENSYSVIVEDDGRGMTKQQIQDFYEGKLIPKNNGYGLKNIMERVKLINGGTLTLESEPGVYTKVIVTQFI